MQHRNIIAAAAVLLAAFFCSAADPAPANLPTGESILDRFVEVTGGEEAHTKFSNRTVSGRIEIPGSDAKGTFSVVQAKSPDRALFKADIVDTMASRMGMSGDVVWSLSDVMGVEIKRGAERESLVRQLVLGVDARWREFFKTAETMGVEEIDGRPAHKIKLTANDGAASIRFFDFETGELVRIETEINSATVQLQDTVRVSDYRDFDGVRLPTRSQHQNATLPITFVIETIEHDRNIPESTFELPKSVKALLAKQAARSGATTSPAR